MIGNIQITNGLVHCNVLDCKGAIASFNWVYVNTANKAQKIINSGNIIGFMGEGRYFCEVKCGDTIAQFVEIVNHFDITNNVVQEQIAIPQAKEQFVPTWDFNKIPKKRIPEIRRLFKSEKLKDLALIHNEYQLSNAGYCCNLEPVRQNVDYFLNTYLKKK